MSKLVMIDTEELMGAALDWAIAQVEECAVEITPISQYANASTGHKLKASGYILVMSKDGEQETYAPSADWGQGGPLIQKYNVWLHAPMQNKSVWGSSADDVSGSYGMTPLVAVCRAILASKIGESVSVPSELVKA